MSVAAFFKVVLVAMSLGLDVFAVSIGVGMRGMPAGIKWRIGIAFTAAEIAMTLIGAGIGQAAGVLLGDAAGYIGFAALTGVGIYMVIESFRERKKGGFDLSRGWGLLLGALSISLDSLGVGFSILYIGVPLMVSLVVIGATSATSTALGLTLGGVLGARAEASAATWGGIILIATGLVFAVLKLFFSEL